MGSPPFHSACPAVDTMKVLGSPARLHAHPAHVRELPQPADWSYKPIQPESPPPITADASAEERSVASVAPALRLPQSAAESAQDSPVEKEAKQKEEDAGATQPAGHSQLADPASGLKVPVGHGAHEEAPAALYAPAPQAAHVAMEAAPSAALAFPAAQRTQLSLLSEL